MSNGTPGTAPGDGFVRLGVNLEGMRHDDWPVARLIEWEIARPLLLTRYLRKGRKTRRSHRAVDAWRVAAFRPTGSIGLEEEGDVQFAARVSGEGPAGLRSPAREEGALAGAAPLTARGGRRRRLPSRFLATQPRTDRPGRLTGSKQWGAGSHFPGSRPPAFGLA